jgi:hypothetical protein
MLSAQFFTVKDCGLSFVTTAYLETMYRQETLPVCWKFQNKFMLYRNDYLPILTYGAETYTLFMRNINRC